LICERGAAATVVDTDLWHCPTAGNPTTITVTMAAYRQRKDAEMTDVIELLLQDHRLIGRLADELDRIDDPADIGRLYLRIVDELSAHEAAEQEVWSLPPSGLRSSGPGTTPWPTA
jgi:hypothetical protein